jgi:hypothetical protein
MARPGSGVGPHWRVLPRYEGILLTTPALPIRRSVAQPHGVWRSMIETVVPVEVVVSTVAGQLWFASKASARCWLFADDRSQQPEKAHHRLFPLLA